MKRSCDDLKLERYAALADIQKHIDVGEELLVKIRRAIPDT
ncbi:hypothetical protein [Octadecabacter antarcticus]|nr:hypothetical protein [Octadecabacter antarcticus]